jgi:hypothetical protein
VGFEPKIPVFERVRTFHALDRAATIEPRSLLGYILFIWSSLFIGAVSNYIELNVRMLGNDGLEKMRKETGNLLSLYSQEGLGKATKNLGQGIQCLGRN